METPTKLHLQLAKRVLRYLKGTIECGIFYKKRGMMTFLPTLIVIMPKNWKTEKSN